MCDSSSEASDRCQPFGDMKLGLQLFLSSDVADDLCGADYASVLISYGRDRERDIDSISVLFDPYRLKVVNSFACPYLCQNHILVIQELCRNQGRNGPPYNICRFIPKDSLSPLIPISHDSVQVLADNCVTG